MSRIKDHLKEADLSYWSHMKVSLGYAVTFSGVVVASVCHAIIPTCYVTYTSDKIKEMYNKINNII